MSFDQWTSISAFTEAKGRDGHTGCLRRWAFKRFFKLPTAPVKATAFGDVFHAVLQRFYEADDRGLVNGVPVNLYPDGWKVVPDRFGRDKKEDAVIIEKPEITPLEEMCIKNLIDKAINEGVLVRTPGRLVEQPFPDTIIHTDLRTGSRMVLKGFIDLETPVSVEDHKTVKSRKWALSLKALETDAQMLTYAAIKYAKGHLGDIWLIHNNFIKDPDKPEVLRREILVGLDYVVDYFNRVLLPGFGAMFNIFLNYKKTDIGRWREIAGPIDTQKECNHYYGAKCPFSCICSGTCDIPTYFDIFKELNEQLTAEKSSNNLPKEDPNLNSQTKGTTLMVSLMDRIKAGNAAVLATPPVVPPVTPSVTPPAAVAPATVAPVTPSGLAGVLAAVKAKVTPPAAPVQAAPQTPPPPPAPEPTPATPAAPAVPNQQTAPWYQPGCQACSTNVYQGFNTQGNPCPICDNVASLSGKPTSSMYIVFCDTQGKLTCTPKPGTIAETPAPVVTPPASVVTPTIPAVSTQVSSTTPTIPQTQTPAPEKRKRRTKEEIAADEAAKAAEQAPTQAGTSQTTEKASEEAPVEKGFSLLIGVTFAKGYPEMAVSADDLVKEMLLWIEDEMKKTGKIKDTYLEIKHFDLMEYVELRIATIAQMLSDAGAVVVSFQPTKGTALAKVLDGLRPYAKEVLVAMGG